jgi:hypothetical protein
MILAWNCKQYMWWLPPSENITFWGFMSLWTIPVEWSPSRANKSCLITVWTILFSLAIPFGKSWTFPRILVSTWSSANRFALSKM